MRFLGTFLVFLIFSINLVAQACFTPWNASAVYLGSSTASFNGRNYTAQWWTQGNQPDINAVWTDNGPCSSCNTVNAGSIGSAQSIVANATPSTLTNISSASGGDGSNYSYQWQVSTNNSTWADISGATSTSYAPGALTTRTYYRRKATSGTCGDGFTSSVLIRIAGNCVSDTDQDGFCDEEDLDDDNDGILDLVECPPGNFYWSTPPSVNGKIATGKINTVNYTYTCSVNIATTSDLYNHGVFPTSFKVPNTTSIQNTFVSTNTIVFDRPVLNPTLVFASIGNGGQNVPIKFSNPVEVLFQSGAVTINSPTQISGAEGFVILRMNGTFSQISFDYLADEGYVNFSFGADFTNSCDTDGDGISNDLDADSDGDGCADAIEGGAAFKKASLSSNVLSGAVDANGVPVAAGANGQSVGASTDANVQDTDCPVACVIDTDNDGVCDIDDLDDDNDGILDVVECADNSASWDFETPVVGGGNNNQGTAFQGWTCSGGGWINLIRPPYGDPASTAVPQTAASGNQYVEVGGTGDFSRVYSVASAGVVSVEIDFASWAAGTEQTQINIFKSDGITLVAQSPIVTTIPVANWSNAWQNKGRVSALLQPGDYVIKFSLGNFQAFDNVKISSATLANCDTDNDGIVNSLDTDSDGDGCSDAIEGGGAFKTADLNGLSLSGAVDANGVPVVAGASGQTLGASANSAVKDVDCINCDIKPVSPEVNGVSSSEIYSFVFDAQKELNETTPILKAGKQYKFKVTGTWSVWTTDPNNHPLDAAYRFADKMTGIPIGTPIEGTYVKLNGATHPKPEPNQYNALHEYWYNYTGAGQALNFTFSDSYGDNHGTLTYTFYSPIDTIIVCASSTITSLGQFVSGTNLLWYTSETGGVGSATSPNVNNAVEALYTHWVSQTLNGCESDRTPLYYKVLGKPNVSLGNDTILCQGKTLTLNAGNASSYQWNDNSTLATLLVSSAGLYKVTSTNSNNCTASDSIAIAYKNCNNDLISEDTLTICKGKSITINAKNVKSPKWESVESFTKVNDSTITAAPAKTAKYYVTSYTKKQNSLVNGDFETPNIGGSWALRDANTVTGWKTTASDNQIEIWYNDMDVTPYSGNQFIELNANMQSALYQDVATSPGTKLIWGFAHRGRSGTETIDFEVGPPGGPYTKVGSYSDALAWGYYSGVYEVPAGQTTTRFYYSSKDPGAAGNFVDAVEFYTTEEQKDSVVVKVNEADEFNLGKDTTICTGENLKITAPAASSYLWNTAETSNSITVAATGDYSVEITDANACKASAAIHVKVNSCVTDFIEKDTLTICEGDSIVISAIGITTQVWGGTDAFRQINDSAIKVSPIANAYYYVGTSSGYTVGANVINNGNFEQGDIGFTSQYSKYSGGGMMAQGSYAINTNPNAYNGVFTACGDHSSGSGKMFITDASTAANVKIWCQSISTLANTKYEFAAWATSVYNPNPPILQFQVNGNLLGNVFQVEQTVCDWQKFAATWNSGTNTNTEICIINQNIAGGGNDFAIDDISFAPVIETASGADSVLVIVKSKPKVQLGNDTSICQGAIVNIGTTLNGAYTWSTGATTSSIKVGATGVYNLQVKNTDGCIGKDTIQITVNAKPNVVLSNVAICEGDAAATFDAGQGFTSYIWSDKGTGNSQSASGKIGGSYTVKVVDANGCKDTATATLTVSAKPNVILNNAVICEGDAAIVFDAGAGYSSYLWSDIGTGNTQKTSGTNAGTYTVNVVDAKGCKDTASATLTINTKPNVSLSSAEICEGDTAVTFDAGAGYSSYLWSDKGTGNTQKTNGTIAGTYTVKVVDAKGCKDTASAILKVNKKPTVQFVAILPICKDFPSFPLKGATPLGGVYEVEDGSNWKVDSVFDVPSKPKGNYKIRYTYKDANSCANTVSASVVVNDFPKLQIEDQEICEGHPAVFDAGSNFINYRWSTGSNLSKISAAKEGVYSVSVIDHNGCRTSDTMVLKVNALPIVDLGESQKICSGESVTLESSTTGDNYLWNDGSKNKTLQVKTTGTYSLNIIDSNLCVGTDHVEISVIPLPKVNLGSDQEICEGKIVSLSVKDPKASYYWSTGEKKSTISVGATNTITLTQYYDADCLVKDSVRVTVLPFPKLELGNDTTLCLSETFDGALTLNAGSLADSYLWSTGSTNSTISIEARGTYSVSLTNGKSCTVTDQITIDDLCKTSLFCPSAFTPNNDGNNDVFYVKGANVDYFQLLIFNRWGDVVFESDDMNKGWDGTVNENIVQQDVYVVKVIYSINREKGYKTKEQIISSLTLIR